MKRWAKRIAIGIGAFVVLATLWPGRNPIGRRFRIGRSEEVLDVVGVVRTAQYRTLLEEPRPFFYRPFAQVYRPSMTLHVRTASSDPYDVLQSVRRAQALRVALAGSAVGLIASIPAARLVRTQLYGVEPTDPVTLVTVTLILAAASIAAAYLPARRATKVDPVVALRSD